MQEKIDWLNTYEIFFDEAFLTLHNWQKYIQGETQLVQQSVKLLQPSGDEKLMEAATQLGEMMESFIFYKIQENLK